MSHWLFVRLSAWLVYIEFFFMFSVSFDLYLLTFLFLVSLLLLMLSLVFSLFHHFFLYLLSVACLTL